MKTPCQIVRAIRAELKRAYAKHGRDRWGRHEFYAILKEEVDELWADIKADSPQDKMENEAIQVAAMIFRYLETGDRDREKPVIHLPTKPIYRPIRVKRKRGKMVLEEWDTKTNTWKALP